MSSSSYCIIFLPIKLTVSNNCRSDVVLVTQHGLYLSILWLHNVVHSVLCYLQCIIWKEVAIPGKWEQCQLHLRQTQSSFCLSLGTTFMNLNYLIICQKLRHTWSRSSRKVQQFRQWMSCRLISFHSKDSNELPSTSEAIKVHFIRAEHALQQGNCFVCLRLLMTNIIWICAGWRVASSSCGAQPITRRIHSLMQV